MGITRRVLIGDAKGKDEILDFRLAHARFEVGLNLIGELTSGYVSGDFESSNFKSFGHISFLPHSGCVIVALWRMLY